MLSRGGLFCKLSVIFFNPLILAACGHDDVCLKAFRRLFLFVLKGLL